MWKTYAMEKRIMKTQQWLENQMNQENNGPLIVPHSPSGSASDPSVPRTKRPASELEPGEVIAIKRRRTNAVDGKCIAP